DERDEQQPEVAGLVKEHATRLRPGDRWRRAGPRFDGPKRGPDDARDQRVRMRAVVRPVESAIDAAPRRCEHRVREVDAGDAVAGDRRGDRAPLRTIA